MGYKLLYLFETVGSMLKNLCYSFLPSLEMFSWLWQKETETEINNNLTFIHKSKSVGLLELKNLLQTVLTFWWSPAWRFFSGPPHLCLHSNACLRLSVLQWISGFQEILFSRDHLAPGFGWEGELEPRWQHKEWRVFAASTPLWNNEIDSKTFLRPSNLYLYIRNYFEFKLQYQFSSFHCSKTFFSLENIRIQANFLITKE